MSGSIPRGSGSRYFSAKRIAACWPLRVATSRRWSTSCPEPKSDAGHVVAAISGHVVDGEGIAIR